MKKVLLGFIISLLSVSFAACGNITDTSIPHSSESSSALESSVAAESLPESSASDENAPASSHSEEEIGGGNPIFGCLNHSFQFHSIDGRLIDEYVGQDIVNAWVQEVESRDQFFSILSFIEKFEIPKDVLIYYTRDSIPASLLEALEMTLDEYCLQFGYTMEEIDALYSGDQSLINKVFCGPLAVYNENDGNLYSIEWLSEHTAREYLEVDLPLDRAQEVIDLAQTLEYIEFAPMGEKAQKALDTALAVKAEKAAARCS